MTSPSHWCWRQPHVSVHCTEATPPCFGAWAGPFGQAWQLCLSQHWPVSLSQPRLHGAFAVGPRGGNRSVRTSRSKGLRRLLTLVSCFAERAGAWGAVWLYFPSLRQEVTVLSPAWALHPTLSPLSFPGSKRRGCEWGCPAAPPCCRGHFISRKQ